MEIATEKSLIEGALIELSSGSLDPQRTDSLKQRFDQLIQENNEEVLINLAFLVSGEEAILGQVMDLPRLVRTLRRHDSLFANYALASFYAAQQPTTNWNSTSSLYWHCQAAKKGHVASIIRITQAWCAKAPSPAQRVWRKLRGVGIVFRVLGLYFSSNREVAFWRCEDVGLSAKWQHQHEHA